MKKRILAFLCILAMLSSMLVVSTSAETATEGMAFSTSENYTMDKVLTKAPLTYEAVIKLTKGYTDRGGVIVGNYKDGSTQCFSFEINTNGQPRLYTITSGTKVETTFADVNVATGEYLHLAIVVDTSASKAHCYVDGVLKQSKDFKNFTAEAPVNPLRVGSDIRPSGSPYFKGNIRSVAVYSAARNGTQVAADASALDRNDATLMAAYDLVGVDKGANVSDLSQNAVTLVYSNEFTGKGGMTFDGNTMYVAKKAYDKVPATFEAWVYMPKSMGGRGGVILGNYGGTVPCFSFELEANGAPRLYYRYKDETLYDKKFTDLDVRTGDWAHLALTLDGEAKELKCYINGELKKTVTDVPAIDAAALENAIGLGCDLRNKNEQYFKGALKSVTVYSTVRTATEIAADMTAVDVNNEALLAHYDLSSVAKGEDIEDCGKGGYDMLCGSRWMSEKTAVTDYAYSFCVVGDTQKVTYYDSDNLHHVYDWIVANKESKKIEYVFGLGDITEKSTDGEWELARTEFRKLDGTVPYSLVRGNHDGSAQMNKFTTYSYMSQFIKNGGFYIENKLDNTWRTIKIGDVNYLMMVLDYGASDSVLAWASEVIKAHPNHRVIITTHAYLYRDGTTLDEGDVVPPTSDSKNTADPSNINNGDHMWNELISKHENIFLVMSGHDPSENVIVSQVEGENGNIVTQMLIDPQGVDDQLRNAGEECSGMITMLYFSEDGKTVTVETYSTIKDRYFKPNNQFSISVPEYVNDGEPDGDGGNSGDNNGDNNGGNTDGNGQEEGTGNGGNDDTQNADTGSVVDSETSDVTTDTDVKGDPENDNIGVVIGISASVFVVAIAILAIIFIFKKK